MKTGLIAVRDPDDRAAALRVGMLWQRLHLWATANGLAMQPLNQLPERADRDRVLGREPRAAAAMADLIDDPGWHGVFGFRLGYPAAPALALASPRRGVSAVMI